MRRAYAHGDPVFQEEAAKLVNDGSLPARPAVAYAVQGLRIQLSLTLDLKFLTSAYTATIPEDLLLRCSDHDAVAC